MVKVGESRLTVEECVEGVVFDFTQFEKVFTRPWTAIYLEVDDQIA